ncbi:MAG: hypothetical protein QOE30_740 [Mycobacterium sp.]|nr:hypothetical protein [Mycobacterium sp.]
MWNISPALTVKLENLLEVSSTDTSEVPDTQ